MSLVISDFAVLVDAVLVDGWPYTACVFAYMYAFVLKSLVCIVYVLKQFATI